MRYEMQQTFKKKCNEEAERAQGGKSKILHLIENLKGSSEHNE